MTVDVYLAWSGCRHWLWVHPGLTTLLQLFKRSIHHLSDVLQTVHTHCRHFLPLPTVTHMHTVVSSIRLQHYSSGKKKKHLQIIITTLKQHSVKQKKKSNGNIWGGLSCKQGTSLLCKKVGRCQLKCAKR